MLNKHSNYIHVHSAYNRYLTAVMLNQNYNNCYYNMKGINWNRLLCFFVIIVQVHPGNSCLYDTVEAFHACHSYWFGLTR